MSLLTHRHSSYILQMRIKRAIAVGFAWYLDGVRKRTLGLLASGMAGGFAQRIPRHELIILPQTPNSRMNTLILAPRRSYLRYL